MKKLKQKKEQKRSNILRAAMETFHSDGYIGASMDSIARKSGVTKQTVYRYFDSKETLFKLALEAQRRENHIQFLEELEREDSREALRRFAIGFLEIHLSEQHLAGVRLLISEGPSAPEITRIHFALGPEKVEARLTDFLNERFQIDNPEYAVKVLLNTLLSMRMGLLIGLYDHPSREEIVSHAEKSVAIFMKLLS